MSGAFQREARYLGLGYARQDGTIFYVGDGVDFQDRLCRYRAGRVIAIKAESSTLLAHLVIQDQFSGEECRRAGDEVSTPFPVDLSSNNWSQAVRRAMKEGR